MNESMRKIVYYENILEFKQNTKSELHLSEVNNWRLCRTCLVESKEGDWDMKKMCVMDAFEGRFLNPQDMLGKVTTIQFNEVDDLPLKLCKDCLEKLTTLYFFSIQVQKAEKVLKNLSLKLREDTNNQNEAVSEEQNNTDSKEIHEDNNDCGSNTDSDTVVLALEEVVERSISQSLTENITQSVDPFEDPPTTIANGDSGSEDSRICETSDSVKSANKVQISLAVDEEVCNEDDKQGTDCNDDVISSKEDAVKRESSDAAENSVESNIEDIVMEVVEDFDELINDNLQSEYDFEDCKETDETAFENENVATTVEIYLSDEMEEHLDEKDNWEQESESNEGDIEIVVPNTFSLDATASTAEPVHLTRASRIEKSTRNSQFKHRQKRITKPLLESRRCDVCKESFKLQRELVAHVKKHHPNSKAYQCRECGQLFSYTQSLSRHMNTHKDELHKNKCSYCPKAFLRPDDLVRHIRTHTGERPYKCPKCNKAFKQQGEMKQHLTTHLERRAYECDQCNCVLTSRNSLYLHKKSKHSTDKDQQFHCSICKKNFKSKRDFVDHNKSSHDIEENGDCTFWHVLVEE